MTEPRVEPTRKRRHIVWLAVGIGLLLLAGANVHLVYVAIQSQPECVSHTRLGEAVAGATTYGAARSSCSAAR